MGLAQLAQLVGTMLQDPDRQIVASYVERQVAFGPENLGWPRERMRAAVAATLERLGIAHLRDRETGGLSGGERQKVALAGLLAMDPRILLLDEPLASLDPASAREALALFRELADDGRAVLLVEHRVEDALAARPERTLFLRDGRQVFLGASAAFLALADPREVKLPADVALARWGGSWEPGLGRRRRPRCRAPMPPATGRRRATRCWSSTTFASATAMGRRSCAASR